ncbi:MAG: hypothetical protein HC930_08360 [Hydrococcus sp. SU_1_0]|nr:hypothetical protein [Hydrococcus sp. SU_1_0]
MSEIAVEYRPVKNTFDNFQHLYLVYTDNSGKEFTIGGHAVPAFGNPFSRLVITDNLPLQSSDARDFRENTDVARVERNHLPLNLDGRDPEIVWQQMRLQAQALSSANIPYDIEALDIAGESDNSNTTVASVLNAVGIDLQELLPSLRLGNNDVPGSEDLFSEYADRLNIQISGSEDSDIIYGGFGDDVISSLDGDDTDFWFYASSYSFRF